MVGFRGTAGEDRYRGKKTDEEIIGLGGTDVLIGDAGADTIDGGEGSDRLSGGDGADTILGGTGNDVIFGHGAGGANAQSGRIDATLIATLNQPLFATFAPGGDPDALYVVERGGAIRTVDTVNRVVTGTLLELPEGTVGVDGEQGLLGFAFHPDFMTNSWAFVSLVNPDGETQLIRYTIDAADPTRLDPASATLIWEFPRNAPFVNHAGGWIGFGPDGFLYYASGDGGGANDPDNNAQNIESYLGKMHRIDVNGVDDFADDAMRNYAIPVDNPFVGTAGADEIWAYGLRNPWRNSFDRATGDLYIGDVGQNAAEEVNFQAGGSAGGQNYGWVMREGARDNVTDRPGNLPPDDPSLVDPILAYGHTRENGRSVTGGYVYRGPGAGLDGYYVFGDFVNSRVSTFRVEDGVARDATDLNDRIVYDQSVLGRLASFAEGADGALYAISILGEVYRLDPTAGAADGADTLRGGAGDDRIFGEAGADLLYGDDGNDVLSGGFGADRMFGGSGNDRALGGDGADTIDGGIGNDVLVGDAGDDALIGGAGDDRLEGGAGRDALAGNAGNDLLFGGAGADNFVIARGGGIDRIADFEVGVDVLNLRSYGFADVDAALAFARDTGSGSVVFRFAGDAILTVNNTTIEQLQADILI